jgi:hypothetical protein
MGIVRSRLIKAKVRALRGLPSRSALTETVVERLRVRIVLRSSPEDPVALLALARLERRARHDRLLEHKRSRRQQPRRRARPSVLQTGINLWKRRQASLQTVQSSGDSL